MSWISIEDRLPSESESDEPLWLYCAKGVTLGAFNVFDPLQTSVYDKWLNLDNMTIAREVRFWMVSHTEAPPMRPI